MYVRFQHLVTVCFSLTLLLGGCTATTDSQPSGYAWNTLRGEAPIVIAHRGASGLLPEHTLAAYTLAIEQGADYIEPDVVMTRDGVAVCRHDRHLADSTDVEDRPEFAGRSRTIDGRTDWYVSDFTLAELKTLRAQQVFAGRDRSHDGRYDIPTLEQVLDLVERSQADAGRAIGVYIEIKAPAAHREAGLDPSSAVLDALAAHSRQGHKHKVYLQCFERNELDRLAELTELPLILLSSNAVAFDDLPAGITGLGLSKNALGNAQQRSAYLDAAHALGLIVHIWTFRDDRLPDAGYDSGVDEIAEYFSAGIDGAFTDFPATGVAARARLVGE